MLREDKCGDDHPHTREDPIDLVIAPLKKNGGRKRCLDCTRGVFLRGERSGSNVLQSGLYVKVVYPVCV